MRNININITASSIILKTRHYNSFRAASQGFEFLYKQICYESRLPFRIMALQELSMSVGRLEPRHPMRHMIALRKRARFIIVRMYVIASKYE